MALSVLLCDNHLLAAAKPAGLPCVPDSSADESLLDQARRHVEVEFEKPGRAWLGVVHRLDRPVSGVVLFARTSKAAERLTRCFREREVEKRYLGVVEGGPPEDAGEVEQWLLKDRSTNHVRAVRGPMEGAREARTRWRVLARDRERTLVELHPETGRPHQLRVAMRTLGCPLVGDLKYGAARALEDRSIALHAARLVVAHPTRDERVCVESAPPDRPWWRPFAGVSG